MKKTVHILNGQAMYNYFNKTHFLEQEVMIPFNEAMCYGDTSSDLFSQQFIELRASVHQVTTEQYSEVVLEPLKPFFNLNFKRVILWFDTDMFCQINLLTILAWLDHSNYKGEITLHLVDDNFELINRIDLMVNGYEALYKQILIKKETTEQIEPACLEVGINHYLTYLNHDSELLNFIRENKNVPEKVLISLLIKKFKEYGLGDRQYAEIIESYRKRYS
ncbi:hypothetical protein V7138_10775 [Bacillus sp. JJ1533]|uniref:hypothetical protein n=1 Tax=Bacillus sp. JJ1533 TaxID=3122959 RepID=UPI002FFEFE11